MSIFVLIPLTVVIFAGFIAILIIIFSDRWDLISPYIAPCITLLVGAGGIISANLIAAKWREQKKFDVLREHSVNILENISDIREDCLKISSIIKNLKRSFLAKNPYLRISDNTLNKLKVAKFDSSKKKISANLDIYLFLLEDEVVINKLKKSFNEINALCSTCTKIQQTLYDQYCIDLYQLRMAMPNQESPIDIDNEISCLPDYLFEVADRLNTYSKIKNFLQYDYEHVYEKEYSGPHEDYFSMLEEKVLALKADILENSNLNTIK